MHFIPLNDERTKPQGKARLDHHPLMSYLAVESYASGEKIILLDYTKPDGERVSNVIGYSREMSLTETMNMAFKELKKVPTQQRTANIDKGIYLNLCGKNLSSDHPVFMGFSTPKRNKVGFPDAGEVDIFEAVKPLKETPQELPDGANAASEEPESSTLSNAA